MTDTKIETPIKIRLQDYKEFEFEIRTISLVFDLHESRTKTISRMQVVRKENPDFAQSDLVLDGVNLELESIKINGAELNLDRYAIENNRLFIKTMLRQFALEIIVYNNPVANTALSGLYLSCGAFCTQCEAEGFRHITYWPDRPDVMARFFVRIEAPKSKYPILLAGGDLASIGDYDDGRHFAEWNDPWPKPGHLFALVAGDFDKITSNFTTIENRDVELNIYVDKGQSKKAKYAMDCLKRAMRWDEDTFGCAYDLDIFNIVAVRDFNFGAMENKGLNIFNSRLILADKDTATDIDYERIEAVVAHEYFHNWSGNRAGCRDWFQLSLKEGLTVYRDQEFSADMRARAVKRIQDVITLREVQFVEDAGTNAHPVRPSEYASIDNFYTSTIYEKGAEVIRLTRNIIGEAKFNEAVRFYFKTFDGKAATIDDWLYAMRHSSGHALENIENWYAQAGTPIVEMKTGFDENQNLFKIELRQETPDTQGQSNKSIVPIPLQIAFFEKSGNRLKLGANPGQNADLIAMNFNTKEAVLEFDGLNERPIVSILRGFSAPIKLISDQSDNELIILAKHDNDAFVKWESLQTLARRSLINSPTGQDEKNTINQNFIAVFDQVFKSSKDDYAFAAQLLKLPSVVEIMSLSKDTEPEKIHQNIENIYTQIYSQNKIQIHEFYENYDFAKQFEPSAKDAGVRAFFAQCLNLLRFCDAGLGDKLIEAAFYNANNMTDTIAALSNLAKIGGPVLAKALSAFEDKWNDNDLVLDKWFAIQAAAPSNDAISTFNYLLAHPKFNLKNPNRARALGNSFGISNPIGFHQKDGSGYQALLGLIEKLDAVNPNIAAKMASAFERVNMVEPERRNLAMNYLRLFNNQKLSTQLNEVIATIIAA